MKIVLSVLNKGGEDTILGSFEIGLNNYANIYIGYI